MNTALNVEMVAWLLALCEEEQIWHMYRKVVIKPPKEHTNWLAYAASVVWNVCGSQIITEVANLIYNETVPELCNFGSNAVKFLLLRLLPKLC